jgi:N-acetylneuraminic acid mutarotase
MRLLSSFLALALSASTAIAADVAPLSPGVPAGVKHAQDVGMGDNTWLYVGIGAAVIAGIAIAASSGNDNSMSPVVPPPATTTSTV